MEPGASGVSSATVALPVGEGLSPELARAPTPPLNMAAKTATGSPRKHGNATANNAPVRTEKIIPLLQWSLHSSSWKLCLPPCQTSKVNGITRHWYWAICSPSLFCLVDGAWSEWSSYGDCSASCGGGAQSRTRTCTNPAPQHGGKDCDGPTDQTAECNSQRCPGGNRLTWMSLNQLSWRAFLRFVPPPPPPSLYAYPAPNRPFSPRPPPTGDPRVPTNKPARLSYSLPRVINFKFPLQPRQKYDII